MSAMSQVVAGEPAPDQTLLTIAQALGFLMNLTLSDSQTIFHCSIIAVE